MFSHSLSLSLSITLPILSLPISLSLSLHHTLSFSLLLSPSLSLSLATALSLSLHCVIEADARLDDIEADTLVGGDSCGAGPPRWRRLVSAFPPPVLIGPFTQR